MNMKTTIMSIMSIIALSANCSFTMEKPLAKPIAPEEIKAMPAAYYNNIKRLKQLQAESKPIHLPLAIIIEQHGQETPEDIKIEAISDIFSSFLKQQEFPVLVSQEIVFNIISRLKNIDDPKHPENKDLSQLKISSDEWSIFDIPNSQFLLFVPKKFLSLFYQWTNIELFSDITQPLSNTDQYSNFITWLTSNKKTIPFTKDQISQIFKTRNTNAPIWDFYISGHGSSVEPIVAIANLSPTDMNNLLDLFDRQINTGTVFIESCSSGGKNLSLLQFKESGVRISHNFLLIVGATSDAPSASRQDQIRFTHDFFNNAAFLQDYSASLDKLVFALHEFNLHNKSPHGTENIPQVWLPGGIGFQTYNIHHLILVIGKAFAQIHLQENKPIYVKNKLAALIYPEALITPLIVDSYAPSSDELFEAKKGKIWGDIPIITDRKFWPKGSLSNFAEVADEEFDESLVEMVMDMITNETYDKYLYPQFISMINTIPQEGGYPIGRHYINRIVVNNENKIPNAGVIRFIRDAFFNIHERKSTKTFLIESIEGFNDISLLLHLSRATKAVSEPHPLEKILRDKQDKNIILKNVMITTSFDPIDKKDSFALTFQIDDTVWDFNSEDAANWQSSYFWNFKNAAEAGFSTDEHMKIFAEERDKLLSSLPGPEQRSISKILAQKKEAISKKKTIARERKEAAELAVRKYKERVFQK